MSALALLSVAKRFWPYLAGAIAIAAVWAAVLHYGAKREAGGYHSRDGEVAELAAAIKVQNARIAELSAAGERAQEVAQEASARAVADRKAKAGLQARLKAAGKAKGDCPVSAVNREGWSAVK